MKSLPTYWANKVWANRVSFLRDSATASLGIALFALLVTGTIGSATGQAVDRIVSIEDAYGMSNFVVSYSTPQERYVLSHYGDSGALPASYQTARLVRIHGYMQTLATAEKPVNGIRYSPDAVLWAPTSELTAIQTLGEDGNGVRVRVTVHILDLRTNLQLIASYEDALADGRGIIQPDWQSLVDDNPWRREMHRWRQDEEAWRMVDDRVAMLIAR